MNSMLNKRFELPDHSGKDPYPLLPMAEIATLGQDEVAEQYDRAFSRFQKGGLIEFLERPVYTGNQLRALQDLQERAVAAYVQLALPRLRVTEGPRQLFLGGRKFTRDGLSHHLVQTNGGKLRDFQNLFVRVCDVRQVASALESGTDRTATTRIPTSEEEVMGRFGITDPEMVTYAKKLSSEPNNPIIVDPSQALLVYGPEALQAITHNPEESDVGVGPSDFMMFIDKRLMKPGLLAIIQN